MAGGDDDIDDSLFVRTDELLSVEVTNVVGEGELDLSDSLVDG